MNYYCDMYQNVYTSMITINNMIKNILFVYRVFRLARYYEQSYQLLMTEIICFSFGNFKIILHYIQNVDNVYKVGL